MSESMGGKIEMQSYWNHNTAFHDELVADAKVRGGRVLDIGCGDGLLSNASGLSQNSLSVSTPMRKLSWRDARRRCSDCSS
jgi:2-polyprenyl-3-methyl-5-hydroxy-6-metoxy-1,4-benzoquinol methylase